MLLAVLAALSVGPMVTSASASSTACTIPVGSGVVSPSGGNTVALGSVTAFYAHVTCTGLDLTNYSATLTATVIYPDGSACGSKSFSQPSAFGVDASLDVVGTCSTPYYSPHVNELQSIVVTVTTTNGIYSSITLPIA